MLEIICLSIIQGVTEFLPISSSAHLILFSNFFNFNNENLTLDVSLHLGSLLAIILYFKSDILNFIKNKNLFLLIVISSFPTIIFGYILVKFNFIGHIRSIEIIGWTTIVFSIILYCSDFQSEKKKINNNFNLKSALFIGLFQVLALVPGVSRSGITISAARFLNFKRTEAAKISFLISIPTLLAVSCYSLQKLIIEKGKNEINKFIKLIFEKYLIIYIIQNYHSNKKSINYK